MSRTDYHIQNDPELNFLQAQRKFIQSRGSEPALTPNPLTTVDLTKDEELKYNTAEKVDTEEVKEEKMEVNSPKQEVKTEEEEKNQKEGEMDKENMAEEKSEQNHSIPQTTAEEKLIESADTPTLPVPSDNDVKKEDEENPTGTEKHKPHAEKTSEEEEEEKIDEDDKSEKSSQAEGKHCRSLTMSEVCLSRFTDLIHIMFDFNIKYK